MLNQKKWFLLVAALFLGLAAEVFAPEEGLTTAEAATRAEMGDLNEASEPLKAVCTEDIWMSVYEDLMFGTEMTGEKLIALALAEVKSRDLDLMANATDHIVTYHGQRFAITDEDYQVLLKIVEAEAGTEDVEGKMLVANVILNRMEIGFGGNTISEVVFDEGQFSPIADGRFFKMVPTETTIEAVERVLDGEDFSEGALYFMSRTRSSKKGSRWFDKNLQFLFKHGGHEFYAEKD